MTTETMKITDAVFRVAVTEICCRYHDAYQRWSTYKVRIAPPVIGSDLKIHAGLWDEMKHAKENVSSLALGLLGLLPAAELNNRMQRMAPELLQAAEKRKRLKTRSSRNR